MKKDSNKGFVLVETLIVTAFVAGVLVFLYIQFNNLSRNYYESYKYNTVTGLYSLIDIEEFFELDINLPLILDEVNKNRYADITDCSLLNNNEYCKKLLELENISHLYVTTNNVSGIDLSVDDDFSKFISKINETGTQKYRIIASFKNGEYATIRIGENYE